MKLWKILSAVILFFTSLLGFAVEVVNAGHSGWNSRQLREIFAGELQNHRPDLVVLMVGTNDNLNSYNLVPLSEYRDNLTAMVVAAKAFGANVLLCEIPRVNEEMMSRRHKEGFFRRESAEKKVNNVNAIVAEVAKNQNVPLLATTKVLGASTSDAASLFRNTANSGTADGVHPTANGYFRFADAVAKRIRSEKWSPNRILCIGDSITFGAGVKGGGSASPESESYPGYLFRFLNGK